MVKKTLDNSVKRRYKMYKAGKSWLYAPLLFISLGAGMYLGGSQVHADTNEAAPATAATTADPGTLVDQQKVQSSADTVNQGAKQEATATDAKQAPTATTMGQAPEVAVAAPVQNVKTPEMAGTPDGTGTTGEASTPDETPGMTPRGFNPNMFVNLAASDQVKVSTADQLYNAIQNGSHDIMLTDNIWFRQSAPYKFHNKTVTIDGQGKYWLGFQLPADFKGTTDNEAAVEFLDSSNVTLLNVGVTYPKTTSEVPLNEISGYDSNILFNASSLTLKGTIKLNNQASRTSWDHNAFFYADGKNPSHLTMAEGSTVDVEAPNRATWIGQNFGTVTVNGAKITDKDITVPDTPFYGGCTGLVNLNGHNYYNEGNTFISNAARNINGKVYYFQPTGGDKSCQMTYGQTTIPGHDFTYDFGNDGALNPQLETLKTNSQKLWEDLNSKQAANPGLKAATDALNTAISTAETDVANPNVDANNLIGDWDALQTAINGALSAVAKDDAATVQQSPAYVNASQDKKDGYDAAVHAGTDLLTNNKNATPDEVMTALDNILAQKALLDGDANLQKAKDEAKAAVKAAQDNQNKVIENSAMTTEEKDALQDKVDAAAQTANTNIDGGTTIAAVKKAGDDGVIAIKAIMPGESDAKKTAKDAVKTAQDAQKKTIDDSNLTDEEKDALKQKVDDEATKANGNIDQATTDDAVKKAGDDGANAIKTIVPGESDAKKTAKDAVKTAQDAQKKVIDDSALTDEEKTNLKAKVDDEATKANNAIDQATTDGAVKKAGDDGVTAIKAIMPGESEVKKAAKDAVKTAQDAQKKTIDESNLTAEEKDALKQKVDDEATKANGNIDQATTDDAVKKAGDDGANAIKAIVPGESDAKKTAKDAVKTAQDAQKKVIDDSALTDEEKDALKAKVDDEATKANGNIDQATTDDAVKKAGDDGANAIKAIVPGESDAKKTAKDAVKTAQDAQKKTIDDSNLTDEEKDALKQKVDDEATKANGNIDQATTDDAVKKAGDDGANAIKTIVPGESASKKAAVDAVKKAQDDLNKNINGDPTLTPDQKKQLTDKVNADAGDAINKINRAKDNKGVNDAKNEGLKDLAKDSIKAAEQIKDNQIDNDSTLTTDEKNAVKGDDGNPTPGTVAQAADDAFKAIDNASDPAAIDDATTKGETTIKNVPNPTNPVRSQAKDMIAKRGDSIKKQIDQMDDLTPDEKATLKNQVDADVKKAQEQIDDPQAKTNDDVTKALDNGRRDLAKDLVKAAQENQHNLINKSDLTNEEKKAKNDQVDQEAKSANNQIDQARDDNLIKQAGDNGVKAIQRVTPGESVEKQQAKDAINQAKKILDDKIDADPNIKEKDLLKQEVNKHADNAITEIDQATTNDGVKNAKLDGLKNLAEDAIERAEESKRAAIDDAPGLTDDERKDLKTKVNEAGRDANNQIQAAKDEEGITTARDEGVTAIEKITIPTTDSAKNRAKGSIDDEYKKVVDGLEKDPQLTPEQKTALKKAADDAKQRADDSIDKAKTDKDVTDAENNGLNDLAKVKGKQAIDDKLNQIKQELDGDEVLTPDQKKDLKADADKVADAAKQAIDEATTPEAINKAKDDGLNNLDKSKDKAEIRKAQNEVDEFINDPDHHLTPDEQKVLTEKTKQDADDAIQAIDKATDRPGVEDAKKAGLLNLDRERAKAEIKSALNENNADLDNDQGLKPADKDQLKKVATDSVKGVDDVIDQAKTQDEIDTIKNDALNQIDKTKALAEIIKARDVILDKVAQDTNLPADMKKTLTDAVNQEATNAQAAIDHAVTKDGVTDALDRGLAKLAVRDAEVTKQQQIAEPWRLLSPKEKQDLTAKLATEVKAALDAIDRAQDQPGVETAKKDGVTAILGIRVPDHSPIILPMPDLSKDKNNANKAIDEALQKKQDEIAKAPIDDQTKDDLNKKARDEASKAKEAIKNGKTGDAVKQATENGVKAIEGIKVPTPKPDDGNKDLAKDKDAANKAIDEALQKKQDEIAKAPIDDQTKDDLNKKAQDEANKAKEAIKNGKTGDAVKQATEDGVKAIEAIEVPTPKPVPGDDNDNHGTNGDNGSIAGDGAGTANGTQMGAGNNGATGMNAAANGATTGNGGATANATAKRENGVRAQSQIAGASEKQATKSENDQLPQTGNETNRAGVIGLALANLLGLAGLAKLGKRDREN